MNKDSNRKIIVYGGTGLVGSRIVELLSSSFEIIAPSHSEVDLLNKNVVEKHLKKNSPNAIIYAAGLTSIDECEKNPDHAYLLNAKIPGFIAEKVAVLNIPLFYFSTNAVFDGANNRHPYKENDKPNPISTYGKTKLLGEEYVLSASYQNIIIRIIMVYPSNFNKKLDFARNIVKNLKANNKTYGITDQIINPIFVDDVIIALKRMLRKKITGIYHLGAIDYLTNYEFAIKIANVFHLNSSLILPITLDNFFKNSLGKRTKFSWLDTKKLLTFLDLIYSIALMKE